MISTSLLAWARAEIVGHFLQRCRQRKRSLAEAKIDASFSKMANDPDYRRASIAMGLEFETSDWEALGTHCS
jgi:hypothetical protein